MKYRILLNIVLLSLTACLSGCFSSRPADLGRFLKPSEADVVFDEYILQPSDNIITICSERPTINNTVQIIRPDGKVSFEEIGEVEAAGKTPAQLSEDIRLKLLSLYQIGDKKPVDVQIAAYRSDYYYVLGQVEGNGPRLCTGRDTLVSAISIAQPNSMAWLERVQVIRPSSDKTVRPAIFELNYDRMMAHGDFTKDVLLQSGDIVYVPPTVLGWTAMKIEEVIRPLARAFTGMYTVRAGLDNGDRPYYGVP